MLQRYKLRFQVETPLFCSGFRPQFSELRAASIKGVLRYWYRAVQPDLSKEQHVFGSTKQQSAFRLQIDAARPKVSRDFRKLPKYFTFFLQVEQEQQTQRKRKNHKERRQYIQPGEKFSMNLLFLPNTKEDIKRDVLTSIWLMTTIGGLGSRGRRGFGTLSLLHPKNKLPYSLFSQVDSIQAWERHVQKGLQQCWDWYPPKSQITHPAVHPNLEMFVHRAPYSSWNAAMSKGASVLQGFRKKCKREKQVLKLIGMAEGEERDPSATWLRIIRVGDQYYPVYFLLPNDLPTKDYQQFVARWGGWLEEQQFEMSEINR